MKNPHKLWISCIQWCCRIPYGTCPWNPMKIHGKPPFSYGFPMVYQGVTTISHGISAKVVLSPAPLVPTHGNRPSAVTPAGGKRGKNGLGASEFLGNLGNLGETWENGWLMWVDVGWCWLILRYFKQQEMRILASEHGAFVAGLNHVICFIGFSMSL